jgi:hypothetical protein
MVSSSSTLAIPASLSIAVFEKFTRDNYRLWRAQVVPAIRAARLEWFIDGSEKAQPKTLEVEKESKKLVIPNPDYAIWVVRDQHVLTYLVMSLSREVLAGIASNSTTTDMWVAISKSFASQSQSRVLHLRNQLVATWKGEISIVVYFSTMRGFTDEMASAGKPLNVDDDVASYILNVLDVDYNSLIEHVNGMIGLSVPRLSTLGLLTLKLTLHPRWTCSVSRMIHIRWWQMWWPVVSMMATGKCIVAAPATTTTTVVVLVAGMEVDVRVSVRCWKRFDKNFPGPETNTANAATSSYILDPAWYADSVATDHITGDLDKLIVLENYGGNDHVHTTNGSGMAIQHIGQSMVPTPSRQILL